MKIKWELVESNIDGQQWFKCDLDNGYMLMHVWHSTYDRHESLIFIPNPVNNPIKIKEKVKK